MISHSILQCNIFLENYKKYIDNRNYRDIIKVSYRGQTIIFLNVGVLKDTNEDEKGGMYMNKNLLRSVMALHGDTNKSLAGFLNISEKSFSDKINENNTEFKQSEMDAIIDRYDLSDAQIRSIFFS